MYKYIGPCQLGSLLFDINNLVAIFKKINNHRANSQKELRRNNETISKNQKHARSISFFFCQSNT